MSISVENEEITAVILDVKSVKSSSTEEPPPEEWSSIDCLKNARLNKNRRVFDGSDLEDREVCTKYIPMSDSDVFRHPYYRYPGLKDPGIKEALLKPEIKMVYADDGQDRYKDICNDLDISIVNVFHRSLVDNEINLSYYCVSSMGIYAISKALEHNRTVEVFNLTYNFLNIDCAYHLGYMLTKNTTLAELNLTGCRVGANGAKYLILLLTENHHLRSLNLNRNKIGDDGCVHIANAMVKGLNIKELYLSYNDIGTKGILALAAVYEYFGAFTHLDLSQNSLFTPYAICKFLNTLAENTKIRWLNLAWNSLVGQRIATSVMNVTKAPFISYLNLSNNKFFGKDIDIILQNLKKSKTLHTLDLSNNPMSPEDAYTCLNLMRYKSVKLKKLILENVPVGVNFIALLMKVRNLSYRIDSVITHGSCIPVHSLNEPDMRNLVLSRIDYVLKKQYKKNKIDIALVMKQLLKDNNTLMPAPELEQAFKLFGFKLDKDLFEELICAFCLNKKAKVKTINIEDVVEYIERKWPERQLPPTPPPQPEPSEVVNKKNPLKNEKAKGKRKQ